MQGGARSSGPGFLRYLEAEKPHFQALLAAVKDKRHAKAAMARYRAKRSVYDHTASSLLRAMSKVRGWLQV